jgi:hypothetical protein
MNITNYFINKCPTWTNQGVTLKHLFIRWQPNVKHLCVFASETSTHIDKSASKKLNLKIVQCMLVGYDEN